uniref:Uncharacterized protein n=1 Tax=Anguilla anguilla TaxID=7936 RepID=A0A0E9QNE6_ANGAN
MHFLPSIESIVSRSKAMFTSCHLSQLGFSFYYGRKSQEQPHGRSVYYGGVTLINHLMFSPPTPPFFWH